MKKSKSRMEASILSPDVPPPECLTFLDTLTVRIHSIRQMDDEPKRFNIKVTFQDQLIIHGTIKAVGPREEVNKTTLLLGAMSYDPSDYEKMSLMVDFPLCVQIYPLKSAEPSLSSIPVLEKSDTGKSTKTSSTGTESLTRRLEESSACNVDIMKLILEQEKQKVKKRLEPVIEPSVLNCKSWDNLPLITMSLKITRDPNNTKHHEVLKRANHMSMTIIASYNMIRPYDDELFYIAASKMPMYNETNTSIVTFTHGRRLPKRFNCNRLYPQWESLRMGEENFVKGDDKLEFTLDELQNDLDIPFENYLRKIYYTTVWGSFHRSLLLEESEGWFSDHIRQYYWPLELHMYGETGGYSFMALLNLFKLLYPGEDTVRMVVPLQWISSDLMAAKCGGDLLLTPNDKGSPKSSKTDSGTSDKGEDYVRPTGSDENNAFVILEIKLARPLKKIVVPKHIPSDEINRMLNDMEQAGPYKRECTGRGQQDRDWHTIVQTAVNSLRRVPYYGVSEFSVLNRQLSESRTRVEITTSFWQDAAVYVNNNFVVQNFLHSDETIEEMIIMSHACLMKSAISTLVGTDNQHQMDPTLKAARHARQMQDIPHALELYLQLVVQKPRSANSWRELSTCLKDVDRDWANVCINKSVVLNPRHPLSLISKGCMLMEEDPAAAEPFFIALLALFPFWSTGWIITSAYYIERELFHMADQILECNRLTHREGLSDELGFPRYWDYELGDWWDYTPLLPGLCPYYDAADLLLRLRCISLSEVCLSRALSEAGETAAYYHMVALCCRLRGNIDDALCHVRTGLEKYGEISYLRALEAECHHKNKNLAGTAAAFEKAGTCVGGYSLLLSIPNREPQRARTMLVDLVRRQPSAYTWMTLADDWMNKAAAGEGGDAGMTSEQVAAKTCAAACCVQALKFDRRAGRAWALLAKLVKPSARRMHCLEMAKISGYATSSGNEKIETKDASKQSLCYRLGKALRECRCVQCEHIQF